VIFQSDSAIAEYCTPIASSILGSVFLGLQDCVEKRGISFE
jgi:hypothetical protein